MRPDHLDSLKVLTDDTMEIVESYKTLIIRNKEDRRIAEEVYLSLNEKCKNIKEAYDDLANSAYKHWKAICAKRASFLDPAKEQATAIKQMIAVYDMEEERKRIELERKLREEAIKKEEERILQDAMEASPEEAEIILSQTINVAPVIIPREKSKVRFREIWSAEVTDLMELVKAVAEGKVSVQSILPNMAWLRKKAEHEKLEMRVPGVRSFSRKV